MESEHFEFVAQTSATIGVQGEPERKTRRLSPSSSTMASVELRRRTQFQELVSIVVNDLGGTELLSREVRSGISAEELYSIVARDLGLASFSIDLADASDGSRIDPTAGWVLEDRLSPDSNPFELMLFKVDLPTTNPSGYIQLQSTGEETGEDAAGNDDVTPRRFRSRWENPFVKVLIRAVVFGLLMLLVSKGAGFARLLVAVCFYLVEALQFNRNARALYHSGDAEAVLAYVARIKAAAPRPWICFKPYHWETVTRTESYTDADGRQQTRFTTAQEKRYTQEFRQNLAVGHWSDDSGELHGALPRLPLVSFHFEINWQTGDADTMAAHDRQSAVLRNQAQLRDTHYDFEQGFCLAEAPEGHVVSALPVVTMICRGGTCPEWVCWRSYVLATCLGLSWAYRWKLSRISLKSDFVFRKRVWHSAPPHIA